MKKNFYKSDTTSGVLPHRMNGGTGVTRCDHPLVKPEKSEGNQYKKSTRKHCTGKVIGHAWVKPVFVFIPYHQDFSKKFRADMSDANKEYPLLLNVARFAVFFYDLLQFLVSSMGTC